MRCGGGRAVAEPQLVLSRAVNEEGRAGRIGGYSGAMGRKVVSLTMDNLDDLPDPCRNCTLWELGSRAGSPATKDEWLSGVLLDWGSCGRVLYVDDEV